VETIKLGKDGTFIDYCKNYGGNCGVCFKLKDGLPECYEPFINEVAYKNQKKVTWKKSS